MKPIALALLLLPVVGFADPPEVHIIAFSTNAVTYTSTQTNLHTQAQFRFDLRTEGDFPWFQQNWHTLGTEGSSYMTTSTNTLTLPTVDWGMFVPWSGSLFLRVLASSNALSRTTTPFEMTLVNHATTAVSNILITMAGADENFQTNALAPHAACPPFTFHLEDHFVLIPLEYATFYMSLTENTQERDYSFFAASQRFTVTVTNGTFRVTRTDAN